MCIKKDILATLTYFNMFDYPLKKREIYTFLGHEDKLHEFNEAIIQLTDESAIYKIGGFYSLFNNYALVERRSRGNEKAEIMLKKAEQAAALIGAFPFVKGVAVSGSLSKKFADEDADIDFFIITAASRLWIARTFLHIFKKITFLFRMEDFFCMNYFIDEAEPGILEKNIYTATEVATIMPLRGNDIFETFYKVNAWTKKFFPNKYMHISSAREIKKTWIRSITEKILDNKMGNALDTFLMKMTARSWNSKTRNNKKNSKGILMSMHTGKHFSKPNPANFQKKLLQRYEKSLIEVFDQYERSSRIKNKTL
ncbi:MAG: nucleotidyltransferase domain-containing protein [Bacteroidota bacterium]